MKMIEYNKITLLFPFDRNDCKMIKSCVICGYHLIYGCVNINRKFQVIKRIRKKLGEKWLIKRKLLNGKSP